MNVSLEQRQAHLPQSVIDVGLRDGSVTPEILEYILQFVGKL